METQGHFQLKTLPSEEGPRMNSATAGASASLCLFLKESNSWFSMAERGTWPPSPRLPILSIGHWSFDIDIKYRTEEITKKFDLDIRRNHAKSP